MSTKSRHEPPASRQQAKAQPVAPVVSEVTPGKGELSPAVRARGTRQKSAIRSVIENSRNPLLPAEILEGAKQAVAGLGLATIYRNLKTLVEAGEVRAVELPGEPTRFESAHLGHHHHFQCRNCMKVFDVHSCSGDFPKMVPKGFTVERHELTLYGLCSACTPPRAGI